MRTVLLLLALALPAAAQTHEPLRVTLIDGSVVTLLAPCEVQANRPKAGVVEETSDRPAAKAAPAAPCRTCGAACDCGLTGTCVCDREAAARAAAVERPGRSAAESPARRLARLRAIGGWGHRTDGATVWTTLGQYLDAGGSVDNLNMPGLSPADRQFLRDQYAPQPYYAPPPVTVVHPVAAPMPAYAPPVTYYRPPAVSVGGYVTGPFGEAVGAGVCVGGG